MNLTFATDTSNLDAVSIF